MISKRLHPASFSNVNAQLAQITPNGAVMTNLVTNGDFSNSYQGFQADGESLSTSNNTLSCTGTGGISYPYSWQDTSSPIDITHKYYQSILTRVTNPDCQSINLVLRGTTGGDYKNVAIHLNPTSNTWYRLSAVETPMTDAIGNVRPLFQHIYADAATANGKVMEIKNIIVLDLTAIYGAGNEPTAAQMDELLSFYNNSWFNGNANITDLLQYVVSRKANKTQGAWITPTLLNGWSSFSSPWDSAKYFQDEFGIVHLRGIVFGGAYPSVIFTLPVGLRPQANIIISATQNDSYGAITVDSYGDVYARVGGAGTWLSLSGISFKAG